MKIDGKDYNLVQTYAPKLRGVFTTTDLSNLLNAPNKVQLYRKISQLENCNLLQKFCRGIFTSGSVPLAVISQRICPKSYISLGNVLAQNLMIGSIPQKTVYAIKNGKNRIYSGKDGEVIHFGISPRLFFGFGEQNSIRYADKEKALLDVLYFYQIGKRFSFNIYSDIAYDLLDRNKITTYLKKYNNPKFRSFVLGLCQ